MKLMCFTELSVYLNKLNVKLQGYGKSFDAMYGHVSAFESKLDIFQRDLETKAYKYFPRLQNNLDEFSENDEDIMNNEQDFFLLILSSLKE